MSRRANQAAQDMSDRWAQLAEAAELADAMRSVKFWERKEWPADWVTWRAERVDGGPWRWIKVIGIPLGSITSS